MKFSFIEEHLTEFRVKAACQTLGVSRSGYCAWLERPESTRARRREELAVNINRTKRGRKLFTEETIEGKFFMEEN